jgi:hypothetical protein
MMKASNFVRIAACLALLGGLAGGSARAQQESAREGEYNKATEVTVSGTIRGIQTQKSGGALPHGTYVTLQTGSASYTLHMGAFAPSAIPFKVGDSASVTGSLTTINGAQVLLARTMQSGSHSLTLRSTNGFVLRSPITPTKGGLQ